MTQKETDRLAMQNAIALVTEADLVKLFGEDIVFTFDNNMLSTAKNKVLNKLKTTLDRF